MIGVGAKPVRVRLLDVDRNLGEGLSPEQFQLARKTLVVTAWTASEGEWKPPRRPAESPQFGLLIAGGLMVRELGIGRGRGVELLTHGDLLRPAQEDSASFAEARWRILEPIVLAQLDSRVSRRLAQFPVLVDALLERAMNRSRSLAVGGALASMRSLDDRLLALLWHLAERHGTRGNAGVELALPLTHQILADLVGARRPSVTNALNRLARRGQVTRMKSGWRLQHDLPTELGRDWEPPAESGRAGLDPWPARNSGAAAPGSTTVLDVAAD